MITEEQIIKEAKSLWPGSDGEQYIFKQGAEWALKQLELPQRDLKLLESAFYYSINDYTFWNDQFKGFLPAIEQYVSARLKDSCNVSLLGQLEASKDGIIDAKDAEIKALKEYVKLLEGDVYIQTNRAEEAHKHIEQLSQKPKGSVWVKGPERFDNPFYRSLRDEKTKSPLLFKCWLNDGLECITYHGDLIPFHFDQVEMLQDVTDTNVGDIPEQSGNSGELPKFGALSEKAQKYYTEVAYSLDYGDGEVATPAQVLSHCLEELAAFENRFDESVTSFLAPISEASEVSSTHEKAKEYLISQGIDPVKLVADGMQVIKSIQVKQAIRKEAIIFSEWLSEHHYEGDGNGFYKVGLRGIISAAELYQQFKQLSNEPLGK